MNSVGVNAVNQNPQMAFKAKTANRKQIHEFIDKTNDLTIEFLNKDRPIAEKKEIMIRRSVNTFMKLMEIFKLK